MMEADLAISAGGQTLYELACVGCPTVAVQTADNQNGQLCVFEESGFLRIVGCGEASTTVEGIAETVGDLLANPQVLARMSLVGQRLIDGQGALRVARVLLAEVERGQDDG